MQITESDEKNLVKAYSENTIDGVTRKAAMNSFPIQAGLEIGNLAKCLVWFMLGNYCMTLVFGSGIIFNPCLVSSSWLFKEACIKVCKSLTQLPKLFLCSSGL